MEPSLNTPSPHLLTGKLKSLLLLVVLISAVSVAFLLGKKSETNKTQLQVELQPTKVKQQKTVQRSEILTQNPITNIPSPRNQELNSACTFHPPLFYEIAVRDIVFDESVIYCGENTTQNKELLEIVYDQLWKGKSAQGGPALTLIKIEGNYAMGKEYAGAGYGAWFGIKIDNKWSITRSYTDVCSYLINNGFPFSFVSFYQC